MIRTKQVYALTEAPNHFLDKFEGSIRYDDNRFGRKKVSCDASNFLLRGCSLKNTKWIIGVAVFTGKETKIFQNTKSPEYKLSNLEHLLNYYLKVMLII